MRIFARLSFALPIALVGAALAAQQPAAGPSAARTPLDMVVAIVGDQPITLFDVDQRVINTRSRNSPPLTDPYPVRLQALSDLIDEELLLQKAKELKVEVPDADLTPDVDRAIKEVRGQFTTESQYRQELINAGFGTPEEYRRYMMDQDRRNATVSSVVKKLRDDNKLVNVNVTDSEVVSAWHRDSAGIGPRPPSVTFKQIIITPRAGQKARDIARARAETLLARLKAPNPPDFAQMAKRETMDSTTRDVGGDLGWIRRGDLPPQVEYYLFPPYALAAGQISPVIETPFDFEIVRVEHAQTGEVRARAIKIVPTIDSVDIARAAKQADTVATQWKAGVSFDTLARKYHDYAGKEETSLLTPFEKTKLPPSYQKGFEGKKPGEITIFPIPTSDPKLPKYVVAQLQSETEGGVQTLSDVREQLRGNLVQVASIRRYLDELRSQTYVMTKPDLLKP